MAEKRIYTYRIEGETPSKKNANKVNFKTKRTYKSTGFRAWHESAAEQIRLLGEIPPEPIDYPVLIHLTFTHGDLRRRDSDNGCSSIMDLLQDVKILKDDNWQIVRDIGITNFYKKNDAGCEVVIQEL